jgi:hypothetical protein
MAVIYTATEEGREVKSEGNLIKFPRVLYQLTPTGTLKCSSGDVDSTSEMSIMKALVSQSPGFYSMVM